MKDWKFLKQPEFLVTTTITILLSFWGGTKYEQHFLIKDSQVGLATQNQQGDNFFNNFLINDSSRVRKLDEVFKKQIDDKLSQYNGTKVVVKYLSSNSEAYDFSAEIIEYVKKKEYEVEIIPTMPLGSKMQGQSWYIDREGVLTFEIGDSIQ